MNWRNAGHRTKLGPVDGSVLGPIILCGIAFHWITIIFLLCYATLNLYISWKGRTMSWVMKRLRSFIRNGIILGRPSGYWRRIIR